MLRKYLGLMLLPGEQGNTWIISSVQFLSHVQLFATPWITAHQLEKTLESPLDCKEIQPVHPKGNQSWIFFEGLMLKLKLQYFGHLMRRADSPEKTLMLGGIGGRRRRGQQRMRWLDGITNLTDKFEWTPGVGDGQGGLVCCSPWGHEESDTTEWLNWK